MSVEFADSNLLDGVSPSSTEVAESDSGARITKIFHDSLYASGITTRHRPRTGGNFEVDGGIANDVVTAYVEHAFLSWLLKSKHGMRPEEMPDSANCQSPDVDPEVFFPEDDDPEDFIRGEFGTSEDMTPEGAARGQRYLETLARAEERKSAAKDICDGCVFSLGCLTNSIVSVSEDGVWGGLDERERHLMINRFESIRRSYNNGKMPKRMREDFEDHARQIALRAGREARAAQQAARALV